MEKRFVTIALMTVVLSLFTLPALAQTTYGSQLMTPQERMQHRTMMRRLPPAEREAYRAEIHEKMKQRAEESGLAFPENPPQKGRNMRGRHGWGYPGMGRNRGRGYDYPYGWRSQNSPKFPSFCNPGW